MLFLDFFKYFDSFIEDFIVLSLFVVELWVYLNWLSYGSLKIFI